MLKVSKISSFLIVMYYQLFDFKEPTFQLACLGRPATLELYQGRLHFNLSFANVQNTYVSSLEIGFLICYVDFAAKKLKKEATKFEK